MTRRFRDFSYVALGLAAIYVAIVYTVPPTGDFPLNDDWAYGWSVRKLLESGQLRQSEWSATTALAQVYWGAVFAKLFGGFSFTTLRWSTLAMSFFGSLALYGFLRQLGISERSARLGMLTIVVNPLYLYLSYTFMSDIFYICPMLLSLALYVRGIETDSGRSLLFGSLFAAAAYFSRQLGMTLPITAAAVLSIRDRRFRWQPLLLVAAVPVLTIAGHALWLQHIHGVPWGFRLNAVNNSLRSLLTVTKPVDLIWRLLTTLLYLGMFTLPVLIASFVSVPHRLTHDRRLARLFSAWTLVLIATVAMIVFTIGVPMPYLANVINRAGLGALTLPGAKAAITPGWVFWLVTIVAPVAGAAQAALWTDVLLNARREFDRSSGVILAASVAMAVLTAVIVILWDEYLLVFIPASLYLVLRLGPITRWGFLSGVGICVAMLAYGVNELADYMAWNRARWSAARQLVAEGVPPEAIEGGFEWAGWHKFETALPAAIAKGYKDDLFAWMDLTPPRYVVAFSPLKGHRVVSTVPYRVPRFGRSGSLYVLQPPSRLGSTNCAPAHGPCLQELK